MLTKPTFPQILTTLPNWVCWRLEPDKKSGRDVKVPYNPATGYKASHSDKTTWGTLDASLEAQAKYLFPGIGFVFTTESRQGGCNTYGSHSGHRPRVTYYN